MEHRAKRFLNCEPRIVKRNACRQARRLESRLFLYVLSFCCSSLTIHCLYVFFGSVIINDVPLPFSLSTSICPLCFWTILNTIARPSPVPLSFVVKKGSKSFSTVS